MSRGRAPAARRGIAACIRTQVVGDQLWTWQLAQAGGNRMQLAALVDRFDNAAGTNLIFAVTGTGRLVGTVLLTIALVRNRTVPTWAAVVFALAVFANVVAFSANSVPAVTASFVLLLRGMGGFGLSTLRAAPSAAAVRNELEPALT